MTNAMIEPAPVPAIYAKVNEIRKKVGRIAKNGIGPQTQGSYKFLAIDDILEAVKPLEDEAGIISYPLNHSVTFHYNTAADKNDGRVPRENVQGLVDFVFRYVAAEDGSFIDVSVPGEGIDSQDKATRKAVTQAQKIANILLYNIITGEQDPDGQDGGAEAQTTPAASNSTQRTVEKARNAGTSADQKKIVAYIGKDEEKRAKVNELHKKFKESGLAADKVNEKIVAELGL